jgi:hypothetical protein
MSFHQNLRDQYRRAVVSQCSSKDCKLDLTSLPSLQTILDCDLYSKNYQHTGGICDFLIFWSHSGLRAAAVEMKGGAWKVSEVQEQLQAGAKLIETLAGAERVADFQPVLVSEGARPAEFKRFLDKRVAFRGRPFHIILMRCGEKLET